MWVLRLLVPFLMRLFIGLLDRRFVTTTKTSGLGRKKRTVSGENVRAVVVVVGK